MYYHEKSEMAKYNIDDKLLITNCRPISILTFFSKIFERLMYNRLLGYLIKNNILCHNQYGFREKSLYLYGTLEYD